MVHGILLIGQSNMAGRGFVKDVPPIEDNRIRSLKNGRWQRMYEPLSSDRFFAGISLAPSFAERWLLDHPDEEIGLIAAADGGSALDEWMPGEALFDHAVLQAELAKRICTIDAILWHQGESDCPDGLPEHYEEKFEVIISALREKLDLPEVPLIIGGLNKFYSDCPMKGCYENGEIVTEHLKHFAETHENTYFVSAEGFTFNPDHLHFDAISQRKFGRRYYEAYRLRTNVLGPVEGEEEIEEQAKAYQSMTKEERAAMLLERKNKGFINNQEYEFRISEL